MRKASKFSEAYVHKHSITAWQYWYVCTYIAGCKYCTRYQVLQSVECRCPRNEAWTFQDVLSSSTAFRCDLIGFFFSHCGCCCVLLLVKFIKVLLLLLLLLLLFLSLLSLLLLLLLLFLLFSLRTPRARNKVSLFNTLYPSCAKTLKVENAVVYCRRRVTRLQKKSSERRRSWPFPVDLFQVASFQLMISSWLFPVDLFQVAYFSWWFFSIGYSVSFGVWGGIIAEAGKEDHAEK